MKRASIIILLLTLIWPLSTQAGIIRSRATGNASATTTWFLRTATFTADAGTNTTTLIAAGNTNSFIDADVKTGDTVAITAGGGSGNSGTVSVINSATSLTTSTITGMTTGSTFEIRRVPVNGDRIDIANSHIVTIDTNLGTVGGGGLASIIVGTLSGQTPELKYSGSSDTTSRTIVMGSSSNASGAETGTAGTVTYTAAGTPASTPGVTLTLLKDRIQTENWAFTCTTAGTSTTSRWTTKGSVSGQIATSRIAGTTYTADPDNGLGFQQFSYSIDDPGAAGYQVGDTFTFATTAATFHGIFAPTTGTAATIDFTGTAAHTLTIKAAVQDGTKNIYLKLGAFNSAGSASALLNIIFCDFEGFGSINHEGTSYQGVVASNSAASTVTITDSTFLGLLAIKLFSMDTPNVSRNTFNEPMPANTSALITSTCGTNKAMGTFSGNTLNDTVGRTAWFLRASTNGTGLGGVMSNNTMLPTGTDNTKPWRGMFTGGGTVANPVVVTGNYARPLADGTLAIQNFPGGDTGVYGWDSVGAELDFHDNVFKGSGLYEFEQNTNGSIYNNYFGDAGFNNATFLKQHSTTIKFYNNIIYTRGGGVGMLVGGGSTTGGPDFRIYNNTFISPGGDQMIRFVGGTNVTNSNYQFYNNLLICIALDCSIAYDDAGPVSPGNNVFTTIDYNVLYGFVAASQTNGRSSGFGTPPAAHETTNDPKMVSTTYGNPNLAKIYTNSSAIDAGTDTTDSNAIPTDYYKNARKLSTHIDIGAVEGGFVLPVPGGFFSIMRR